MRIIMRTAMLGDSAFRLFVILLVCAFVFVWLTSGLLPDITASHFGASGAANGFMPRESYLRFMLAFVVLLPLFMVLVTGAALRSPKARINLPNREYWLAPERRAETVRYLRLHMVRYGSMLVVFLCYVHWLVVVANAVTPPRMPLAGIIGGLIVFVFVSIGWTILLFLRFRKPGT